MLFKKRKNKSVIIHSPCDGTFIKMQDIKDPVFSQKMMGDCFAISPSSSTICSPIDGKVIMIFPTNHAVGILTKQGDQILVHIGIDSVSLKGKGFTRITKIDNNVKVGDPLISVDLELLKSNEIISDVIVISTKNDINIITEINILKCGDNIANIIVKL